MRCETCGCFDHVHGGCKSRGHGPDCHGIHTMYYCGDSCECCTEPPKEEE